MVANQPRHLLSHGMVNIGTCFSYIREFAVHAPFPRQTLRADYLAFAGVEFMVRTFTSLIAFAVFGVLAVGFANLLMLAARVRLSAACWNDGDVLMRPSVDDYRTLLVRAFAVLTSDSSDARQEIYDRARAALKAEFDKLIPPPSDAEFFEER
jgi:hypothetical protein